jgi:hypothetical protein
MRTTVVPREAAQVQYSKKELEENLQLQMRLRFRSEERESQAHSVAAALDEVLTLLLMALAQAAETPRGMQARRARRLLANFKNYRLDALDGKSVCRNTKKVMEADETALEHTDRLVR